MVRNETTTNKGRDDIEGLGAMPADKAGAGRTYTITELAQEFAITPRAIRFYEDKDLLVPLRQGQARIYTRRDRARLFLILRGKRLGFSLSDIKEILDLYDMGDGQKTQLKIMAKKVGERIEALKAQRRDMDAMLEELGDAHNVMTRFLKGEPVDLTRWQKSGYRVIGCDDQESS